MYQGSTDTLIDVVDFIAHALLMSYCVLVMLDFCNSCCILHCLNMCGVIIVVAILQLASRFCGFSGPRQQYPGGAPPPMNYPGGQAPPHGYPPHPPRY